MYKMNKNKNISGMTTNLTLMKKSVILDLRNIYSKEITKFGFQYYSIGNN